MTGEYKELEFIEKNPCRNQCQGRETVIINVTEELLKT